LRTWPDAETLSGARLVDACLPSPAAGRGRGASSEHPQSRTQDRDQQRDDDNAREYEDEFAVAALSLHPLSVASGVTHYEVLQGRTRRWDRSLSTPSPGARPISRSFANAEPRPVRNRPQTDSVKAAAFQPPPCPANTPRASATRRRCQGYQTLFWTLLSSGLLGLDIPPRSLVAERFLAGSARRCSFLPTDGLSSAPYARYCPTMHAKFR
jgi:hypothetical protein